MGNKVEFEEVVLLYSKVNQAGKEVTVSLNCRGVSTCKVKTKTNKGGKRC